MAYQSWSVVYGEQPAASKWNILGTNDAHFYSFLGDTQVWTSYVPTITNLSGANNTITGAYIRIGNIIRGRVRVTLGAGFSISGSLSVGLPVPAVSSYSSASRGGCANGVAIDSGTAEYMIAGRIESTTTIVPLNITTSATYSSGTSITSTAPFTWVANDYFTINFIYEAAA